MTRGGHIETWYDRDILAGSDLNAEIERELELADIFLLLVSPDFIASDYCVEREMARALERHATGKARVVPIIVEECDWKAMGELRQLKAVPTDGKAISEWANANTAYLNVVQELRRIIDAEGQPAAAAKAAPEPAAMRPSLPRYRAKRQFDQIDRLTSAMLRSPPSRITFDARPKKSTQSKDCEAASLKGAQPRSVRRW